MDHKGRTRRDFLRGTAAGAAACLASHPLEGLGGERGRTRHYVTLSFDDGFEVDSIRTAEIHEKFGLAACINVIATGHLTSFVTPDEYHAGIKKGNFGLWNELRARGHEIGPHGYRHANKTEMPLAEAKDLIRRCLDVFDAELRGFDPKQAIFNFPYNASTPELEEWLAGEVRAFRTGGGGLNPVPQGQARLTCTGHGPGNSEEHLEREIEALLREESGWLIYNLHGLDAKGWGPIRSSFLEALLERLSKIDSLSLLPVGPALDTAG